VQEWEQKHPEALWYEAQLRWELLYQMKEGGRISSGWKTKELSWRKSWSRLDATESEDNFSRKRCLGFKKAEKQLKNSSS
jgi:hypothetical protein